MQNIMIQCSFRFQTMARLVFKPFIILLLLGVYPVYGKSIITKRTLQYIITFPQASSHCCHVDMKVAGWDLDSIHFKLPQWMPGYYQIMHYAKALEHIKAMDHQGKRIPIYQMNENTWGIKGHKNASYTISYDIKTFRQFVANSYVDSAHAYIIPGSTFLYVDGSLQNKATIKINLPTGWNHIATGLDKVNTKPNEYSATDFDILYDCPILLGNLEELPAFKVKGIEHRFIGYKLGSFDRAAFMDHLSKVVESAVAVIGDIPYKQYTFIAIGPGRGGIEHLNNTTFGFDGNSINNKDGADRMLSFLAHEYFHHYNVKRIRPLELGPFDYDQGSKTNLLWVSEGLSVYYQYMILMHAGLIDSSTLFNFFDKNINALENNPGRAYQSLAQASYNTWSDGPFGTQGTEPGKSISYYDKGPVVGLLLDLKIRSATQNTKSLNDVMRLLYWKYYKQLQRGFTDAEFQQACESTAGIPLTELFEYVSTTKALDYTAYLNLAGLKLETKEGVMNEDNPKKQTFNLIPVGTPDGTQQAILRSWLNH